MTQRETLRQERFSLGDFLRSRREELRIAQRELARALGVSHTFIASLESGTVSSSRIEFWLRLADALQLSGRSLLERVWSGRSLDISLTFARGDHRRERLLDLAIEACEQEQSARQRSASKSEHLVEAAR